MEKSKASEVKGFSFWPFILWPGTICVLYVLSLGPAVMLCEKKLLKMGAGTVLRSFYSPAGWLYEKTPLHKPLGMYLHLWSKRFDKNGELIIF